ncbi:hypothetical protein, partial [Streptomyces sp. NPDC051129]|uniref:hypothetical protein n=1 Tax=Streptomyces sp. NPDC051129 TaxID=3154639 RepID=UPI0034233312
MAATGPGPTWRRAPRPPPCSAGRPDRRAATAGAPLATGAGNWLAVGAGPVAGGRPGPQQVLDIRWMIEELR